MKSLHPVSQNPPPERTKTFWGHVRFFIETIWALFGGPEHIAALHAMSRADHALLAAWLRKAETLVRKLLLVEAAELAVEERKYKARAAPKRTKRLRQFYADEPHLWRVSFQTPVSSNRLADRRRPRRRECGVSRFPDAWPLAERFEALLRVFDAPERYIIRLARRLRRHPQAAEALCAVPLYPGYEDVFEDLRPPLARASQRLKQSDTS